jgi:hypothetical protein
VTGVWLWWRAPSERKVGALFLTCGAASFLLAVYAIVH